MQRWQYTVGAVPLYAIDQSQSDVVLTRDTLRVIRESLDAAGEQGWELTGIIPASTYTGPHGNTFTMQALVVYKRPK